MRILSDECVPRRLKREFVGHEVLTVPEAGWASIKNGALLLLAQESFDVFVTVDRGMRYQQNLSAYKIAVIVLVVRRNKYEAIQPLIPKFLESLDKATPGKATYVGK